MSYCHSLLFVVVILTARCFAGGVPAEEQGAVLRMLAAQSKQTWDHFGTWRGEFEVQDVEWYGGEAARRFLKLAAAGLSTAPAEFTRTVQGRVEFAVDFSEDRLWSRFETRRIDFRDSWTNADFKVRQNPFQQTSIVTPEHFLRFEPNVPHGGGRMAFRDLRAKADNQQWGAIVDPRTLLGYGRPTWENLQSIAQALEQTGKIEVDGFRLLIIREETGEDETYEIHFPGRLAPGRFLIQEMTFSKKAGYNLTLLRMHDNDGRPHQQLTWEYVEQDGVHLPSRVEYKSADSEGRHWVFTRTLRLTNSTINEPIPAETWTYRSLGLKDGDRYRDQLEGVTYLVAGDLLQREDQNLAP